MLTIGGTLLNQRRLFPYFHKGLLGTALPGNTITSTKAGQWNINGVAVVGQIGTTFVVPFSVKPGDIITQGGSSVVVHGAMWEFMGGSMTVKASAPALTFSRASQGSYYDVNGVVQLASIDQPRFTYDPNTLEYLGLLSEESKDNLFKNSEVFTGSGWSTSSTLTIAQNATSAPNGLLAATKIMEISGAALPRLSQNTATTSGTQFTISIFAKAAERTQIGIRPEGDSTRGGYFDLSAGTMFPAPNASLKMEKLLSGWYRCSLTYTATQSTSSAFIATASGQSTIPSGDPTKGVYVWGAQFEAKGITSYIPTPNSDAVRQADTLFDSASINNWYNQAEGVFVVDCGIEKTPTGSSVGRNIVEADSSTGSGPTIQLVKSGTSYPFSFFLDGTGLQGVTASTGASAESEILGFGYSNTGSGYMARKTGGTGMSISSGSSFMPTVPVNKFQVGKNSNGLVRRVIYFPKNYTSGDLFSIVSGQTPLS